MQVIPLSSGTSAATRLVTSPANNTTSLLLQAQRRAANTVPMGQTFMVNVIVQELDPRGSCVIVPVCMALRCIVGQPIQTVAMWSGNYSFPGI
jgi:hypothetical protein